MSMDIRFGRGSARQISWKLGNIFIGKTDMNWRKERTRRKSGVKVYHLSYKQSN